MVCECDNEAHVLKKFGKRMLFCGHRTDCASVERREVAAQPKSKQPRLIRPDGKHFCQNSDIQRGISAVRDFEVKFALLNNV